MKRFRLKVYREIFDAIKSDPTRYETIKNYADDINPILNRIASEYLSIKCCTTFFFRTYLQYK